MAVVGEGEFVVKTLFDQKVDFSEFQRLTDEALRAQAVLADLERRFKALKQSVRAGLVPEEAAAKPLEKLAEQIRALGGDAADFDATARRTGGALGFIGRATEQANSILGRFGLTMRDLNVILGSGFLSTSGPALVALLGVALVAAATKAFFALTRLGAEAERMRDRLQAGFGESARIIEEFAQGSARNFGLTEAAAIRLTGTIGNLFQSFGTGQETAAQFAVDLANAARIIVRTSFTTDSYEQALEKLRGALTGNVEALREYGIAVNETTLRDVARQHGIRLVSGELDAASKALLTYLFITDQARGRQDAFNETTEDTLTEQQKLSAAWTELQTTLGEALVPTLRQLIEVGQGAIEFVDDFVEAVIDAAEPVAELVDRVSDLLNLGEIAEFIGGPASEDAFERFAEGIGVVNEEIAAGIVRGIPQFREQVNKLFDDFTKGKITADEFFEALAKGKDVSPAELQRQYEAFFNAIVSERPELEKYRDELFDTTFAQKAAEEALRAHNEELKRSPEHLNKLIDAYENLDEVVEENAKRLKDAQKSVAEAEEEGKKSIAEAEKNLEETKKDAAKSIEDAEENLAKAEEDRIEAIADARENLRDVQEDAAERIEDAEEKLKKTRLDAAKKVDEAERRLVQARRQRQDQLLDASLSLEEALARGDVLAERRARLELGRVRQSQQVRDAERALDEARIEGQQAIEDAKENLRETIEEENEKIAEAEEKLAETIEEQNERVIEAEEKLVEAREEAAERIIEAQERLDEAEAKAIERLQEAKEKLAEVKKENAERLEEAKQKVRELEGAWSDVNAEVDELIKKLDELRSKHGEFIGFIQQWGRPTGTGESPGGFAHGGIIRRGQLGIVGERGPELFIPNSTGTILPNDILNQLIRFFQLYGQGRSPSSGRLGGTVFNVYESVNGEATARAIAARLAMHLNN